METVLQWLWWAGVDWGSERHAVCVVDQAGKRVQQFFVANTPLGLSEMITALVDLCEGNRSGLAVAIEMPHGPVVDALLEAGFTVFTINPKQIDRFRDRYSPAGAKDDRRDAFVCANALRTDPEAFRRLDPQAPAVVELREWSRIDHEVAEDLLAQANRLRAQVLRVAPHWLELCPAADERWFWALLELAPTPHAASTLNLRRVQTVLRKHRIRRLTGEGVLAVWKTACPGTPDGVLRAVGGHIAVLLPRLRLLHAQRRNSESQLKRCLDACREVFAGTSGQPSDVDIVLSAPGIGVHIAACLIGEASNCISQRDLQAFRAQSGISPITKSSGKARTVLMRRACHLRLRNACFHWGRVAMKTDPRTKEHYGKLAADGHGYARAVRGASDRLASRLFAMLRDGTLYNPNHSRVVSGPKKG